MDALSDRPLVVEREREFFVSTSAYRSEALFQEEMQKIFYRNWIFLCHESEIANPGDYKSTWIGLQPVVVVRDGSGKINAFLNFCPHRGAALCRHEYGNTKAFVCPYHGWTYRVTGELLTVTDKQRYPAELDASKLGLLKVNRVTSYSGLVFGLLADDGPDLETYLGGAKRYIDLWLARSAGGSYKVDRAHKYKFPANWKMQVENTTDGYHPNFVHRSAFAAFQEVFGSYAQQAGDQGTAFQGGATRGFPGGHSTLERSYAAIAAQQAPKEAVDAYVNAIKATYGDEAFDDIASTRHVVIFPNLALMDYNIRVIQPMAVDRTDVYSYFVSIEGASKEINGGRLSNLQTRLGTAGMVGGDDIEIFAANQTGMMAEVAKWIVLSRGMGLEKILDSGEHIGIYSDEVPQRAFWRQWRNVMGNFVGHEEQFA